MIALSFDTETDKVNQESLREKRMDIGQTVPEILGLLKKYDIEATFFVTGTATINFSDLIKKIGNSGHEIGSHSHNHVNLASMKDKNSIKENLEKSVNKLENIVKKEVIGFRAPYLRISKPVYEVLNSLDFQYSSSSEDENKGNIINLNGISELPLFVMDWRCMEDSNDEQDFLQKCKNRIDSSSDGVVCMHPWVIGANQRRLGLLEDIIEYGKENKTSFVTCKEYLKETN